MVSLFGRAALRFPCTCGLLLGQSALMNFVRLRIQLLSLSESILNHPKRRPRSVNNIHLHALYSMTDLADGNS